MRNKPDARRTAVVLVTIAVLFLSLATVGGRGWNEDAVRFVVRVTARLSAVLFVIALAWDDAISILLSRNIRRPSPNRSHFFVACATSHLFHLLALVSLAIWFPDPFVSHLDIVTLVGGGLAYVFIFSIAIYYMVSGDPYPSPPAVTIGLIYIWIIFSQAYGRRVGDSSGYSLIFAALLLSMVAFVTGYWKYRRQDEAS